MDPDIKVPSDEFDGKVTYGQKRAQAGRILLFAFLVTVKLIQLFSPYLKYVISLFLCFSIETYF